MQKMPIMRKSVNGIIGSCVCLFSVLILISILTGCGQSPGDMYATGRTLLLTEETQQEGVKMLEKFVRKFPDDKRAPEVLLAIAMASQGSNEFEKAEKSFNRLIERYPETPEAYKGMFLLGYMFYDELNDNDRAREVLNRFIAAYPDSGLAMSAKVLVDNMDLPVEEWSTVKELSSNPETP